MMAPHLAVGTMRNDKMGEPCFYLMGQNQTTVCSQKSVPLHSPCHCFPFSYIHPFFQPMPPLHPTVCLRADLFTSCTSFMSASFNLCYLTSVNLYAYNLPTHMPASDHTFLNGTNLLPLVITSSCHCNLCLFFLADFQPNTVFVFSFVLPINVH